MSGTDTQVRELLEIAAGEPPGSVSVSEVRHLARRRRTLHGTAVAAAVAAVSVLGSALAVGAAGVSGQPPARWALAARLPPYYVQQQLDVGNGLVFYQPAVVRDTATGAAMASVGCPWAGAAISGPVAPTGDEAFFMACMRIGGSRRHPTVIGSRIYRFQVTSTGTVDGYSLVPGGTFPGRAVYGLTAAADGSALAMWTYSGFLASPGPFALLVVNARTGAHADWQPVAGRSVEDLSLSPNGDDLRFLTGRSRWGTGQPRELELAQVSPASLGGSLGSARMLVHVPTPAVMTLMPYAQVSPDGSVLTVAEVDVPPGVGDANVFATVTVEQISLATGKIIRVLCREAISGTSNFSAVASSDPSGRYIILVYGDSTAKRNGWLRSGRLVPLAPAVAPEGLSETW
jgi:hypothetical protein